MLNGFEGILEARSRSPNLSQQKRDLGYAMVNAIMSNDHHRYNSMRFHSLWGL